MAFFCVKSSEIGYSCFLEKPSTISAALIALSARESHTAGQNIPRRKRAGQERKTPRLAA